MNANDEKYNLDIESLINLKNNNGQMTELQKHLTGLQQEMLIKELANHLMRPKVSSNMSMMSEQKSGNMFERSPLPAVDIAATLFE